jgi:hypothetical protein
MTSSVFCVILCLTFCDTLFISIHSTAHNIVPRSLLSLRQLCHANDLLFRTVEDAF